MSILKSKLLLLLLCFLFYSMAWGAPARYKLTKDGQYDFHAVLGTLLDAFAQDLNALDKSIHKIANYKVTVTGVPKNFTATLKNKIQETVTGRSRIKMVNCVECFKTLVTTEKNTLIIRKGIQKSDELIQIAKDLGVSVFMDTALSYTPNEMIFSASLYDAYTREIVWSRSYSSKKMASHDSEYKNQLKASTASAGPKPYRLNISPGIFFLPGTDGLIGYPGVSASMLEIMGGFWSHFGLTFSGMTPPLLSDEKVDNEKVLDGGGMMELRLYGDLGGEKFRKTAYLGAGPIFTANFQSFIASAGANLDIGKKFGIVSSLFYIAPSDAFLDEDKISVSGSTVNLSSNTKRFEIGGLGFNIGLNMHW